VEPYIKVNTKELNRVSKYNIYTELLVHAILNLAYPKEHIYYMLLIYSIILLF